MKKIILLSSFISVSAFAQNIPLDNLLLLNAKNYCYNVSLGQHKNISDYFNLTDKSILSLSGLSVQAVNVNYPVVSVVNNGAELGKDLVKSSPQTYKEKDLAANPLKNTYAITNSIDLRFNESPGELLNKLNSSYPGLNFKPELLGGGYLFKQEKPVDVSKAKNLAEFSKEYDRYVGAAFTFSISALKGEFKGGSALSYQCSINLVSPLSAQELAAPFKANVKEIPQAQNIAK